MGGDFGQDCQRRRPSAALRSADVGLGLSGLICGLLGFFDILLVVRIAADERTEPATDVGEDFSINIGHPADDRGVILFGLAQQSCLLVLRCN